MSEKDYVVRELKISQGAQFNMIELYKTLKTWFEINRYSFFEKSYEDITKKQIKSVKITWEGQKEVDDYTRYVIEIKLKLDNYEIVQTQKEKLVDGKITLSFESFIESDYEKKWEDKPIWKFIRSVSDKYFTAQKKVRFEKEVEEDTRDIFHKTKTFLNLYKFS